MMANHAHPWDENWILGERLGKGGQGLTYLVARRDSPSDQAALKILKNNANPQARGRMRSEVTNLQVLSSKGAAVPRVIEHNTGEFEKAGVEMYVVMEHIPGENLRDVVDENGPFPVKQATEIALRVCETIDLAHAIPILHRDLKPENIMVRNLSKSDVVIVDYGLSFNTDDSGLTKTDETFRNQFLDLPETNTPGGNRRDSRSDVTAACAIYYFLLTGHSPGQLQDGDGLLPHRRPNFSLKESLGPSALLNPLDLLFSRGFAPNINERFQTVQEFRDRVTQLESAGSLSKIEDPIQVARRSSERLIQGNRKIQLGEFRVACDAVIGFAAHVAFEFEGKLGLYQITNSQQIEPESHFSDDLDRVTAVFLRIQLKEARHDDLRVCKYAVVSRGLQCLLVRFCYSQHPSQNTDVPLSEMEQVVWFDPKLIQGVGDVGEELGERIRTNLVTWINASIGQLEAILARE